MHPGQAYHPLAKLEQPTAAVIDEMRRAVAGDDIYEASAACQALALLGPAAAAAVPELVQAVRWGRVEAVRTLQQLGNPGMDGLGELIGDGVQLQNILRELPHSGYRLPLLPALLQRLRTTRDDWERAQMAQAIGQLGADAADAVPDLLAAAEAPVTTDERARSCSLEALRAFVPAVAPHFDRVLALFRRDDLEQHHRYHAACLLVRLIPHVPAALDWLREQLRAAASVKRDSAVRNADNVGYRRCLASALAAVGAAIAPAQAELIALVADPDHCVREDAVRALAALGDPEVLPHLRRAAVDPDGLVRCEGLKALRSFRDASDETVAAVAFVLRDDNPYIRREAVATLIELEPATAAVRDALRRAGKDTDWTVRTRATAALKRIEGRKGKRK
jgi:HEAT repeat protein